MTLTISSDYLPVGICKGKAMCSLRARVWIYTQMRWISYLKFFGNPNRCSTAVFSSSRSSDITAHRGFGLPHQTIPGFSVFDDLASIVARCASYDAHLATAPQHIPTQHHMLPQHLVCKYELNCEYCNITLARNRAPWWWSDKIETRRSVLKCLKLFYVKLYVHSLVGKLKWLVLHVSLVTFGRLQEICHTK